MYITLFIRSVAIVLTLFFILQFPAQAFAEEIAGIEAGTTTESSSTAQSSESSEEPSQEVSEEVEFGLPEGGESQSMMSGQDINGNLTNVDTKANVGHRSLGVDENSGALQYSYPFTVPNGRGNTTPLLSLDYTNQTASDMDVFGYGWKLSVPYIETSNKLGSNQLYSTTTSNNYFFSTLSGELVQVGSSSSYKAKVESGDFLTYASSSSGWTVTDKVGNKYYFGTASSSRQDNASSTGQVSRWMLAKVEDQNGNYATYTYTKNQNVIYPAAITYSHGTSTTGIFEVRFRLATSTLGFKSFDKGFKTVRGYKVDEVKMLVSGTEVRNYTLRYGNGINGKRELLVGVTERGSEGGATSTLPEMTFGYDGSTSTASFTGGQYTNNFPEPLSDKDLGVRFGDLNGDGLTDVVRYYQNLNTSSTAVVQRVHLNRGHGNWTYNATWDWADIDVPFTITETLTDGATTTYNDMGTRLADVNGDGRDDLVVAYDLPASTSSYPTSFPPEQIAVYLNTGAGFRKDTSWTGLVAFSEWNNGDTHVSNKANTFVDVNGDGLLDIVHASFFSDTQGSPYKNTTSTVYINNGNGWAVDTSLTFPAALGLQANANGYRTFNDPGTRIVDVNADGLIDVVRAYKHAASPNPQYDENVVYFNTGRGWSTTTTPWAVGFHFVNTGRATGQTIVDLNGDRLPDLVMRNFSGQSDFRLNEGDGWADFSYELPFYITTGSYFVSNGYALIDFDGDTLADGWNMSFVDQFTTHATGGSVVINDNAIPDQLSRITLPQGGQLSMALNGFLDASVDTYANVGTSTFNPVIATRLSYSSGFGNQWTTNYNYANPDFYYASTSIRDRKFAGFGKVMRADDFATTTTYYHQANGNSATSFELDDNIPKIGHAYRTEVRSLAGDLYKVQVSKYSTSSLSDGAHFVKLERQTVLDYDGGAGSRDSAVSYSYSDSTGEVIEMSEWGEVNASDDGTFSDTGTDKRTTSYTYAASSTNSILAILSQATTKDQNSATTSATRYLYDSQSFGGVKDGNLTKREHWVATTTYIDYEWTHNGYGLVVTEKDPRDKTTTYVYDTHNLYPATTTNPLSQSTRFTYDYSAGKPKTVTDANSLTQTFVFDGLDRVIEEKVPDPSTGTTTTKTTYTFNDAVGTSSVLTKAYRSSTSSTDTYSYLDGFGRQVQTRTTAEDSNNYIVKDVVFGAGGLLYQESLPYFSSSSTRSNVLIQPGIFTTYRYDALARIAEVQTVVGTTITARDEWEETVTDVLGNVKNYEYDAYGRLIGVTEHNSTSTYETVYEWDHNNNLTKITDALGNVRNITYDGISRRLTLEDLHNSGDATFGTWSFGYDQSGNLLSKVDPKSQTVSYTYDDTNRPLTENYTGQTGTETRYTYDSCTRGIGRLCIGGTNSATTTYTYNYAGLPASEARTISTTTYTTSYTYDRLGNQTLITYPDSSEVRYTYNTGNQLETVEQKESDGAWQNIIEDLDYGPHGQVTYQKHGNGTETTKTYDENELYRLRTLVTTASSTFGGGGAGPEHAALETELEAMGILDMPLKTEVSNIEVPLEAGEVLGTSTESLPEEISETETATTTNVSSSTASTTEQTETEAATSTATTTVEFGLATTTATSTEGLESVTPETAVSTEEVATTTIEEMKPIDTEGTDQLITSTHEARVWQQFHTERVAGLEQSKDASPEAIEAAHYAKDRFDSYLLQKRYTDVKGGPIKGQAQEIIERLLKKAAEVIVSAILPSRAYAYLFGVEDFEDCSSLPCTFSNTAGWGSVTQSLDATSRVEGVDSLKEVVSGEGSAVVEKVNINEDEIWVQFKVYVPSSMAWGASGYFSVLRLEDSSNGVIFWASIEDWGTPRLTFDGDTLPWTDSGITLTEGAVNTIEVRFKKSATVGDVDIWHDTTSEGSPDYNGSGTMNTGTDNVDDIQVGMQYAPETGISTTYYDDVAIDTAFIGELEEEVDEPYDAVLQDLTYVYDAAGNITYMLDESNASSSVMYAYQYDDLYRLTAFGTSTATITDESSEEYQTVTLQPGSEGKDTFYGAISLTGPNGDYRYMYAGGATAPDYYASFIEFDLSSLASFDSIATATLKLLVYPVYATNNAKLQRVTTSWTESSVTSSNVPSATDIGMAWIPVNNSTWWTADVTDSVSDWHDGTYSNYGFKLVGQYTTGNTKLFHTSDSPIPAERPILEIVGITEHAPWVVSASSTFTPIETYTYDAIGNITTKSDVGAYEYDDGTASEVTLPIYTDSVASGWSDQSWSTTMNPSNTSPVHDGTYSLRAIYGGAWSGMSYRHTSVNSAPYDELHLAVNVGTSTSANLYAYFANASGTAIEVVDLEDYVTGDFQASTWHEIEIPLSDLNFENYNAAASFRIESSIAATIYYDNIQLVGGSGTSSYANPHAAISIDGVTHTYDNNGNLTSAGTLTNSWNYDNRLTQSAGTGIATTTYAYDHSGMRVTKTSNSVTTRYPSNLYEVVGTTTTKHIYAGDQLIATVEGGETYNNHLDHLGSTAAVSNDIGYLNQELAYYPFGSTRTSNQYGSLNQSNQYIGQNFDEETDLSYLNARYYDSTKGKLLSQDPVFIGMGVDPRTAILLRDPQLQNSYGYARNNPILHKDPSGELIPVILGVLAVYSAFETGIDLYEADLVTRRYPNEFSAEEKFDANAELVLGLATMGVGTKIKGGASIGWEASTVAFDILKKGYDALQNGMTPSVKGKSKDSNLINQNTRSSPSYQTQPQRAGSSKNGNSQQNSSKSSSNKKDDLTNKQRKDFQSQIDNAKAKIEQIKNQVNARKK